jgi:ABC-type multidrug transport system fused ATPase/permease subunit
MFAEVERLMEGHTIFVVTHRLSVLRRCDLFVNLEDGRIQYIGNDIVMAAAIVSDGAAHR